MKPSIVAKLEALHERHEEVQALLGDAQTIADQERFRALSREYAQLSDVSRCFTDWQQVQEDIETAQMMLDDPEMREMAQDELREAKEKSEQLEQQLQVLLLPKDPDDERNAFLEVRAGTGGDEAALFAGDLFRMYSRYAEARRWRVEIMSASEGEHGGYKLLNLQTYFTAGVKEVRAWTIPVGATAPQAAGKIHTDFEKGFIRAQTISFEDFITYKGEQGAKEAGKMRAEGKDYIVKDGDVMNFLFNV